MKYIWTITIAALFLGLALCQTPFWLHSQTPEGRVMAPLQSSRTQLGDEYYYYINSKKAFGHIEAAISGANREDSFATRNSGLDKVHAGSLVMAGLIDRFTQIIPVGWPFKMALSFIFQAAFLMASLMCAYIALRRDRDIHGIELLLFAFIWAFLSTGFIYGMYAGNPLMIFTKEALGYYPDVLRIVNPQMSWAYTFFYIALLVSYFKNPSRYKYAGLLGLSVFLAMFSIPLTGMMLLGLGFHGLHKLAKERKFDVPLFGIGVVLVSSFVYVAYQIHLFRLTEKGLELNSGGFSDIYLRPFYWILIVFVPLIFRYAPYAARIPLIWLFMSSMFIGLVSECFELGTRLWLRGTGAFAWLIVAFTVTEWLRQKYWDTWQKIRIKKYLPYLAAGVIAATTFISLDIKFGRWTGYIEKDKAEIIDWLRGNTTADDVVLSADLEDSYLIPLYTSVEPYVQQFDYGVYPGDEIVIRYFNALKTLGLKDDYLARINAYTPQDSLRGIREIAAKPIDRMPYEEYQTYNFYNGIIYWPYVASSKDIFKDEQTKTAFDARIKGLSDKAVSLTTGQVDYAIDNKMARMPESEKWKTIFENETYRILRFEDRQDVTPHKSGE